MRDELRALESRKRTLEQTLAASHKERAIELHPNMAELYRKKVTELKSLLNDETSHIEAIDTIRLMIG